MVIKARESINQYVFAESPLNITFGITFPLAPPVSLGIFLIMTEKP